ncbi:MAG: glycosyltransferase family 39 protein [bacterium]|nr:glycosyltransferase family 39 protein [bacterium]
MRSRRIEWVLLAAGFILAFAVRLSFNDDLRGMDLACGNYDGMDYHWLAKNLCRGRGLIAFSDGGYAYRLLRPPGYPLFVAAVYCLSDMSFISLRVADTLLSALSAVIAALIARALAGRKAALIVLLLAVFYRPSAFFATRIFSENLFCFLMLLSILLMIRARERAAAYAAAGALSGLLVLTRPVWLGVLPFILAWILLSRGRRHMRGAFFLIGIAVALAPWVVYCRATLGMPVSPAMFTSLRGIYNTWIAHNPVLGDFTQLGPEDGRDLEHEWAQLMSLRFRHRRLPEAEYMAAVSGEAARFFRAEPARCVILGLRRVYRSWLGSGILNGQGTVLPDTGMNPYGVIYWKGRIFDPAVYLGDEEIIEQLPFRRELSLLGIRVPLLSFEGVFYLMLFGLAASAALDARHLPGRAAGAMRRYSLLLAVAAGYTITNVFSVTIQRFRYPMEYIVLIIAGAAFARALSPLFRFAGAALRAFGIRLRDDAAALRREPFRRPRRAVWLPLAAAAVLALAARCAANLRAFRRDVVAQCAVRPEDEEILTRMGRSPEGISGALRHEAARGRWLEGAGDLGGMLGEMVLWRGEATWINSPSRAPFREEYHLWRAQDRFAPAMEDPGFLRLIVNSYRDPDSIGSGLAITVAPGKTIGRISEGDHLAVLGRLGGTDFVEGPMILIADEVLVLNGAGFVTGRRPSCARAGVVCVRQAVQCP